MDEKTRRIAATMRSTDPETAEVLIEAVLRRRGPRPEPGTEEWREAMRATAGSLPKEDAEEPLRITREAHEEERRRCQKRLTPTSSGSIWVTILN